MKTKVISFFLCLLFYTGFGQSDVSFEEVFALALQGNKEISISQQQIAYETELKKSAFDLGNTEFIWFSKQYNSLSDDNGFSISQRIPFPTLMAAQSSLAKDKIQGAMRQEEMTINKIRKEVKSGYYYIVYLNALHELLREIDSLALDLKSKSDHRYAIGDAILLEKTAAEMQALESKRQLLQNEDDKLIASKHLQILTHSLAELKISEKLTKLPFTEFNSPLSEGNPTVRYWDQQVKINTSRKKVERQKLLPDIIFTYFNTTFVGYQRVGSQDVYFGPDEHFSSFQLGASFPLWFVPQHGRNKAVSLNEEIAREQLNHSMFSTQKTFEQSLLRLNKHLKNITYFEDVALKNADLILKQANTSFAAGEIGYLEYVQALKSTHTIRATYLDEVNLYNQLVIELEFLIGKNENVKHKEYHRYFLSFFCWGILHK
ncbi:MAG: TolC family protein [Flammeovirgaceae bacterium]|nr:TolC family protein [Flammeovirgaceae bacterium]